MKMELYMNQLIIRQSTISSNRLLKMSSLIDDEWSKLSLQVAHDPDNFPLWESLIKNVSKDLTKLSTRPKIERFRITYDQFLYKYPNLEQYWVNYAELEFKLGNTSISKEVYQRGLNNTPYSLLVWLKFLKFLRTVELDYERLVWFYQQAELKVGYHFHSYEFWADYLDFEEKYNGKSILYYGILRKCIELPIYNFAYFFNIWLNETEHINSENVLKIVDENDLVNKLKMDFNKQEPKKIDYHELSLKLKKIYTDLYIVTQYKTFELYEFEKSLTLEYNVPDMFRSYQELNAWEKYLQFIEVNGSLNEIEQLYGRATIILARYPNIWLQYASYHISQNNLQTAKNVLYKSLGYLNSKNSTPIYTKLVKIECSLKNYLKAKDLLLTVLSVNSSNLELFLEVINVEYILRQKDLTQFKKFVLNLIEEKPVEAGIVILKHLLNFKNLKLDTSVLDSINKEGKFDKNLDFWIVYLNTIIVSSVPRAEVLSVFNDVLEKHGEHDRLRQWYDDYLSYDAHDDIKQYFRLNRKLVLNTE